MKIFTVGRTILDEIHDAVKHVTDQGEKLDFVELSPEEVLRVTAALDPMPIDELAATYNNGWAFINSGSDLRVKAKWDPIALDTHILSANPSLYNKLSAARNQ